MRHRLRGLLDHSRCERAHVCSFAPTTGSCLFKNFLRWSSRQIQYSRHGCDHPPHTHTHPPSFPPLLALQNKRFPNHLPAIFLTPLPPLLQVGQIQCITLTLAQGGMALDWKPCQVQSLLSLLLLPIEPLLTPPSDFASRFACLALVYRAPCRSPLK